MRFGVLGPVAVFDDAGAPVAVPEAKVRALLADLLVRPGAAVSADRLIEDLWGGRPPGNPANALQAKAPRSALATVALAGCGGIGGLDNPTFAPSGNILIAPFGQGPISTSAASRMNLTHGTTTSFHVTEDIYTLTYTTKETTNPAGSTCITISPAVGNYVFTITVSAAAGCTYPQTADFTFTDILGNAATLYVQGV